MKHCQVSEEKAGELWLLFGQGGEGCQYMEKG